MSNSKPREQEKMTKAAQAHTNLNMFAAVVSMLESGCIYGIGTASETAQKIARLCLREQRVQLDIYDRAKRGN